MGPISSQGYEEELAYWRAELTGSGRHAEALRARIDPARRREAFPRWIEPFLAQAPVRFGDVPLRGLDLGSGPLSTLAWLADDPRIGLTACDPLADAYRALLDELAIDFPLPPVRAAAEELDAVFAPGSLHFVFSQNALDHAQDIQRCFEQVGRVLAPGGVFLLCVYAHEGARREYGGLHHHDFSCEGGRLVCRDRSGAERLDLAALELDLVWLAPLETPPFDPTAPEDEAPVITAVLERPRAGAGPA